MLGLLEAIGKPIDLNKCTEGYGAATPVGQHDSDTTTRVNEPKPSVQTVPVAKELTEPHALVTSAFTAYEGAWSKLSAGEKESLTTEAREPEAESQNLKDARKHLATLKENMTTLSAARDKAFEEIVSR
ncbi:MAG: hypothetical protein WCK42_02640, partial [Myxococcaceae bacterium]